MRRTQRSFHGGEDHKHGYDFCIEDQKEQAGTELCQAQEKLGLVN